MGEEGLFQKRIVSTLQTFDTIVKYNKITTERMEQLSSKFLNIIEEAKKEKPFLDSKGNLHYFVDGKEVEAIKPTKNEIYVIYDGFIKVWFGE